MRIRLRHLRGGSIASGVLAAGFLYCAQQAILAQTDQIPTSRAYLLQTWQRDDGLPHNTVSAIAQTPDGYLWVGTYEGLTRFDGVHFQFYPSKTTPGLDSDFIECLTANPDGSLWIGLERGGVSSWRDGEFQVVAPLSAYSNRVHSLTRSDEDTVWASLSNGRIMRWRDDRWRVFNSDDGFPARGRVMCDSDTAGRVWFSSENSFGYIENDVIFPLATNTRDFFHVAPRHDGGAWVRRGGRLQQYDAELQTKPVPGQMAKSTGFLQALYEDRNGALWMGTRGNGLYRLFDGMLERVPTSHDFISSICEDREGNLWVGTSGGGLDRLRPRVLRVYDTASGLPRSLLMSMCEDRSGRLWIAARNSPPVSLSPTRDSVVVHSDGWSNSFASVLCADHRGGVWLAALRNGLFRWSSGKYQIANFKNVFITSLFQDSQTNLWVGTLRGGCFNGATEPQCGLIPAPDCEKSPPSLKIQRARSGSAHRRAHSIAAGAAKPRSPISTSRWDRPVSKSRCFMRTDREGCGLEPAGKG